MSYTISNLRQNPITGAFSWRTITNEEHTISEFDFLPNVHGFILRDRPNPAAQLTIITDDSAQDEFVKISSGLPNPGQVRIDYTRGICIFNVADNSKSVLVSYEGGGTNLTYEMLSMNSYLFKMIGEPFPVFVHLSGVTEPPSTHFIKLTKNLTGINQYNYNKLTSQNTVTSGNVRYYTAVISDTSSPLYNQTIQLINSTEISNTSGAWTNLPAVIGALEASGSFFQNQMQGHWHRIGYDDSPNTSGVAALVSSPTYDSSPDATLGYQYSSMRAGEIVSDEINGNVRIGTQTRQDTFSAVYYMRYK